MIQNPTFRTHCAPFTFSYSEEIEAGQKITPEQVYVVLDPNQQGFDEFFESDFLKVTALTTGRCED